MAPKPISTSSSFTAADRAATERAAASSERANRLARRAASTPAAERPSTITTATTAPLTAVPEVSTTAMSGPAVPTVIEAGAATPASATVTVETTSATPSPPAAAKTDASASDAAPASTPTTAPPAIVIPTADTTTTIVPTADATMTVVSTAGATTAVVPPADATTNIVSTAVAPSYAAVTAAPGPAGPMDVDTATSNSDAIATPPVRDSFPPLPSPGANVQSRAARRKDNKGKGKEKASPRAPTPDVEEIEDPDLGGFFSDDGETASAREAAADARDANLQADLARAKAMSLGQQPDYTTLGASTSRTTRSSSRAAAVTGSSTSRRPADTIPETSPKRQRSNTAGESNPSPRVPRSPSPDTIHGEHGRIHNPTAVRPMNPFSPPPVERRFPTADGLPPRGTYTAEPRNGWRPLYGFEADAVWRNHPSAQREKWDREPHPKFLAIVMGGNGDRTQTAGRIATAIAGRINVDPASILVGAPGLGTGAGPDARAWLIGGLPEHLAQVVLESRCLCSTSITLFFLQYAPLITGFLGTIGGLIIPNTREGRVTAMDLIEDAIGNNTAITRFVRDHRDSFPSHLDADQALDVFMSSIGVDAIELLLPNNGGSYVAWNVYALSPTDSLEDWNQLRRLFGLLVIDTTYYGEGRIHPPMSCNFCPSTDHPGPLCPFPRVDGWLGATTANIGELLDISRTARARALGPSNTGSSRGRGGSRGGKGKPGRGNNRGGRGRGY
ncbi:hypothetical protein B0H14DRAFT_273720 [Mycena olivaceomarginata]|nr:hypothetical protein B0H14DRAFT_273720 [Mycena olivaceomarginata]